MIQRVTFPSFRDELFSAAEMRQLVSALELRFQFLEQATQDNDTLFSYDTNELDLRYAQIGHTHVSSEITDLNIPTSIFDLDDVTGPISTGEGLVWDGAAFVAGAIGSTLNLNDINDVNTPSPTDGQALTWDASIANWVAGDPPVGIDTLFDLTDTDLTGQSQGDLLFNASGTEWQETGSNLQWVQGSHLQLGNTIGINWYDSAFASVEFLGMEGVAGATVPATSTTINGDVTRLSAQNQAFANQRETLWSFSDQVPTIGIGSDVSLELEVDPAFQAAETTLERTTIVGVPLKNAAGNTVEHFMMRNYTEQTLAKNAGTWVDVPGTSIDATQLTVGDEYLVVATCLMRGDDSGDRGLYWHIEAEGVLMPGFASILEAPSSTEGNTSNNGHRCQYIGKFTATATGVVKFRAFYLNINTGDGYISRMSMALINISDLEAGAVQEQIDTGDTTSTPYTTYGNPLTVGDGSSDYLLFGLCNFAPSGGAVVGEMTFEVDGTTYPFGDLCYRQSGDNNVRYMTTVTALMEAPAPGTTVETAFKTGTLGKTVRAHTYAIKLDAFEQVAKAVNASPPALVGDNAQVIETLDFTSTSFAEWMFFAATTASYGQSRNGLGEELNIVTTEGTETAVAESFVVGDPGYTLELDGTYVGLKNNIGINWDDSAFASVEMLKFTSTILSTVTGDPDYASTILLLPFDEAGGSTATTGKSPRADASVSFGGNAVIEAGTGPFGDNCVTFDGTGDYVEFANDLVWAFDEDELTMELHVLFSSVTGEQCFLAHDAQPSDLGWYFGYSDLNDLITFEFSENTDGKFYRSSGVGTFSPVVDTWYHIAVVRETITPLTNSVLRFYVGGVQIGVTSNIAGFSIGDSLNNASTQLYVGGRAENGGAATPVNWFNGKIANVRITKGVCRYPDGTTFTPPAAPYAESTSDVSTFDDSFVVGDPAYPTQIDGTTTTVTGALNVNGATDLDSTLNVDGISDFNADVDINDSSLTIRGATEANNAVIAHDDTNLNITTANTSDINIGETGTRLHLPSITELTPSTTDHPFQIGLTTGRNLRIDRNEIMSVNNGVPEDLGLQADGGTILVAFNADVDINDSSLTIRGLTEANNAVFAHDNTNLNITTTSTSDINIGESGTRVHLPSGSDAGLGTTNHPFQIGPDNDRNLRIDANELMAVNNGAASDLFLNADGGNVTIGNATGGSDLLLNNSTDLVFSDGVADTATFQLTNGTTFGSIFAGLADWDITGLTGEMFVDAALRVSGDLTVGGTTTTINSNTVSIADNIILLNSDATNPPTENAGLEIERGGVVSNVFLRWNETSDRWEFTNDGSTYQNILIESEIDHGSITGLGDDDHPQYALLAGNETITGQYSFTDTTYFSDAAQLAIRLDNNNRLLSLNNAATINVNMMYLSTIDTLVIGQSGYPITLNDGVTVDGDVVATGEIVANSGGSQSDPQIRFDNSASTGLYSNVVNEISISANGDRQVLITDGLVTFDEAVNVVGALTALSYGGITEANLLDKTATETITGAYTFDNDITLTSGGVLPGRKLMLEANATDARSYIATQDVAGTERKVLTRGSSQDRLNLSNVNFETNINFTTLLFNGVAQTPANWDTAYNDKINSAAFNTGDGVLTLTQQDAGTVTVDLDGRYALTTGAYIGGSIADNQVAIGNGTDAIDGSSALTFDGSRLTLNSATSRFRMIDTGAAVDNGIWEIRNDNEVFYIRMLNDAQDTETQAISMTRTGMTVDLIQLQAPTLVSGQVQTTGLVGRAFWANNNGAFLQVGGDGSGQAGNLGSRVQTDAAANYYSTYWASDAYWNETTNQWNANRTSLGRKWKAEMGYHSNSFDIDYFDGTVSSPWAESDWSNLLNLTSGGNLTLAGSVTATAFAGGNLASNVQVYVKGTETAGNYRMVFSSASGASGNSDLFRDAGSDFYYDPSTNVMTVPIVAAGTRVNTLEVRASTSAQLVLNAGESSSVATGQTQENVFVNAEAGLQINSSSDNWATGWSGRNTATICAADGSSTLPGDLTLNTGNFYQDSTAGISNNFDVGVSGNSVDHLYRVAGTLTALVRWTSNTNVMSWQDRSPSTVEVMNLDFDTGDLTLQTGDLRHGTTYLDVQRTSAGAGGIRVLNSADQVQGYLYTDGSATFGLLHSAGGWAVQIAPGVNTVTMPGNLNVNGGIDVNGSALRVYDAAPDDFLEISHSGTLATITTAGTGAGGVPIRFEMLSGDYVEVRGDGVNSIPLRISDADASDYMDIYNNGTDQFQVVQGGGIWKLLSGTENMIWARPNAEVELYHNNIVMLETKNRTVSGAASGASLRHADNSFYDVGFNVVPPTTVGVSANFTLGQSDLGKSLIYNTATARSCIINSTATIPNGAMYNLKVGPSAGVCTIDGGTSVVLRYWNGTGWTDTAAAGNITAGEGEYTIWKESLNLWWITGPDLS